MTGTWLPRTHLSAVVHFSKHIMPILRIEAAISFCCWANCVSSMTDCCCSSVIPWPSMSSAKRGALVWWEGGVSVGGGGGVRDVDLGKWITVLWIKDTIFISTFGREASQDCASCIISQSRDILYIATLQHTCYLDRFDCPIHSAMKCIESDGRVL